MRLLLDSHVWLWAIAEPDRLSASTRAVLEDGAHAPHLSVASAWEVAIKWRLGRLALPEPPGEFIPGRLIRDGIHSLPVELHHALAVAALPDHHQDPFDRLLIAQARAEAMTIVTAGRAFGAYEVPVLEA